MLLRVLFVLLFVCTCFADASHHGRDAEVDLSFYCSADPITRQDQRMLGRGDALLTALSSYMLSEIKAKDTQECTALLFKDYLRSQEEWTTEKAADNVFHFTNWHTNENSHSEWKIEALPGKVSGLPVFSISSGDVPRYFAKFYPYPQATDSFYGELSANFALGWVKEKPVYVRLSSPLSLGKCLVSSDDVFYVVLYESAPGKSLKTYMETAVNKPTESNIKELNRALYIAAKALAEFQLSSAKLKDEPLPGSLILPSDDKVEDVVATALQGLLPDPVVYGLAERTKVSYEDAQLSLQMNKRTVVPSAACFSHFDYSTSNVFISEENTATIIDMPLMFRSFGFGELKVKCDTYLTNPIVPMVGISHPSYDYYFFLLYVTVEMSELSASVDHKVDLPDFSAKIKQGYCSGWYKDKKDVSICRKTETLWTIEVEEFMMQYMMVALAPNTLASALQGSMGENQ